MDIGSLRVGNGSKGGNGGGRRGRRGGGGGGGSLFSCPPSRIRRHNYDVARYDLEVLIPETGEGANAFIESMVESDIAWVGFNIRTDVCNGGKMFEKATVRTGHV